MSCAMLAGEIVISNRIHGEDCIEHYKIIKRVEQLKMKALSISCNIDIGICSTVKY